MQVTILKTENSTVNKGFGDEVKELVGKFNV